MKPRPPLLFSEPWRLPPYTGERTDENMRFTPAVVTNPRLEVKLYGPDAKVVLASIHEERVDLWNGMATSPVAITLRDRRNYVDLTDAARLRWIVRTNAIHLLYPVVKLADGRLLIGDRSIDTNGEFLQLDIAFSNMRWYALDPDKVIVLTEVTRPDLSKVDEVGLAALAPGGGHGITGSANFSAVDLFAYPDRFPAEWAAFRRERLTALVSFIRQSVRSVRPSAIVTAAVFPDPQEAFDVRLQDWRAWLGSRLVDAVAPMAYTPETARFAEQIAAVRDVAGGRVVWAGIGAYRLTPAQTIDHIAAARSAGAAGVVLFSYDSLVESPAGDPLGDIGRVAFAPSRAAADPPASAWPQPPGTR